MSFLGLGKQSRVQFLRRRDACALPIPGFLLIIKACDKIGSDPNKRPCLI